MRYSAVCLTRPSYSGGGLSTYTMQSKPTHIRDIFAVETSQTAQLRGPLTQRIKSISADGFLIVGQIESIFDELECNLTMRLQFSSDSKA